MERLTKLLTTTKKWMSGAVRELPPVGVTVRRLRCEPQDIRYRHGGQQRNIRIARKGTGRCWWAGSEFLVQSENLVEDHCGEILRIVLRLAEIE